MVAHAFFCTSHERPSAAPLLRKSPLSLPSTITWNGRAPPTLRTSGAAAPRSAPLNVCTLAPCLTLGSAAAPLLAPASAPFFLVSSFFFMVFLAFLFLFFFMPLFFLSPLLPATAVGSAAPAPLVTVIVTVFSTVTVVGAGHVDCCASAALVVVAVGGSVRLAVVLVTVTVTTSSTVLVTVDWAGHVDCESLLPLLPLPLSALPPAFPPAVRLAHPTQSLSPRSTACC
ncbi:hypothetical protein BC828DRAFT_376275 [Blastocladiella britannica]|nr:hypothetical protein BC828DRAFT_376275 [Blastocladiella britannica]